VEIVLTYDIAIIHLANEINDDDTELVDKHQQYFWFFDVSNCIVADQQWIDDDRKCTDR
jgi:hypothetical protein